MHLRNLARKLGDRVQAPADRIARRDVEQYLQARLKEPSPSTVDKERTTDIQLLRWAVAQGDLASSPAIDLPVIKGDVDLPPFRTAAEIEDMIARGGLGPDMLLKVWDCLYLNPAEIGGLLRTIRERADTDFGYLLHAIPAYTGMRRGEVLRIRWSDVEFDQGHIIARSRKQSHRRVETTRRVDLHPEMERELRIWRERSRACRLHDVQLLDQLLRLAHFGGDPPPLELEHLATLYTDRAGTSEASRTSPRLPSGEPVGADEGPAVRALGDVAVVEKVYRKQLSQSDRLARRLRIPREIVERLGPWALGLQVQGAIALRRASSNGLRLRKDAAPELRRTCEEAYRDCSRLLNRHPTIRRCFRWDGEEIRRAKTGLPDADKSKLREWLRQTLEAMAGVYNTPFELPRTVKG